MEFESVKAAVEDAFHRFITTWLPAGITELLATSAVKVKASPGRSILLDALSVVTVAALLIFKELQPLAASKLASPGKL